MNLSDYNNPYAGNVQLIQNTFSAARGGHAYFDSYLEASG
jgi:hypothetical protein